MRRILLLSLVLVAISASAQDLCPKGYTPVCAKPVILPKPIPSPTPTPTPSPSSTPAPSPSPAPTPSPISGVLLSEGFESGNKGSFDWDADGRTSYPSENCHSGRYCGAKTVYSSGNQQRVFWEKSLKTADSFYFSAYYRFPQGYTWAEAPGTDPYGYEHKLLIVNVEGGLGRTLLNLRYKNAEIAAFFENTSEVWSKIGFTGVDWPKDGAWHKLELQIDRASDGRAQVWLDGSRILDARGPTCGNPCGSVTGVQVGAFVNQGAAVTETFYMDDIVIGTQR